MGSPSAANVVSDMIDAPAAKVLMKPTNNPDITRTRTTPHEISNMRQDIFRAQKYE